VDTKQTHIETDVDWVHEIGRHIARSDTLDEALAATVSFAIALVNCDRCFIYVRDGAELALWAWKHLDQKEPKYIKLPLGKGFPLQHSGLGQAEGPNVYPRSWALCRTAVACRTLL
jgi:GAF domain-containing protein